MAYYEALTGAMRNHINQILRDKVREDAAHKRNVKDSNRAWNAYVDEVIDDWVNRHNSDLSNADWGKQAKEADI